MSKVKVTHFIKRIQLYCFFQFRLKQSFEGPRRMRKANGELGYRYGQSWTFRQGMVECLRLEVHNVVFKYI